MAQMPQLPVRCVDYCTANQPRLLGGSRAAGRRHDCHEVHPWCFPASCPGKWLSSWVPAWFSCMQSSTACHHAFAAPSPPTCRLNVDLANNFLPSRPANVPAYNLAMPPPQPALNAPGMVPC